MAFNIHLQNISLFFIYFEDLERTNSFQKRKRVCCVYALTTRYSICYSASERLPIRLSTATIDYWEWVADADRPYHVTVSGDVTRGQFYHSFTVFYLTHIASRLHVFRKVLSAW